VELDDHEDQEGEAVGPGEPGLESSLLDLSLGVRLVAGQDVAEVVEDYPFEQAARIAVDGLSLRGARLSLAAERGL